MAIVTMTFQVTPKSDRVPAGRFVDRDLVGLGHQVAAHFARHKHLRRGLPYEVQINETFGAIKQEGLPQPLQFLVTKEEK